MTLKTYYLEEIEAPEGYELSEGVIELPLTTDTKRIEKEVPNTSKVSITGHKVWVGGPSEKPTIKLQLYRNGEAYLDLVTLANGTTSYTWNGLDQTDKLGNKYVYTVDEVKEPEYYSGSRSEDKLTVFNTYKSPTKDVTARKAWVNGELNRPDFIELQLYRQIKNGEKESVGETVKLEEGTYEYVWKDQAATDNNGNPYIYTVEEIGVPENYTKVEEGLTVTNTYVIPKTEIIGTKKWSGAPSDKPTIELQLYRDRVKYGDPVKLDGKEETPWTYTWEDLDKTDIDGKEYKYTVDEVKVPSYYYKSISEDGLTITNIYSPPEEPGPGPKDPEKPTEPPTGPEEPTVPTEPPTNPEEPTIPEEQPTVKEETPKETPKEGEVEVPEGSDPKIKNPPENGTVTIDENGKWKYTPNPGFVGKDRFTIIIKHPDGTEEEILIEIDVEDVPLGTVLPKTGEGSKLGYYISGLLLLLLGIFLRRKIV